MAVGHAELRLNLAAYEDSGLSPEEVIELLSIKSWSDAVETQEERTAQENIKLRKENEKLQAVVIAAKEYLYAKAGLYRNLSLSKHYGKPLVQYGGTRNAWCKEEQ
ncbi:MAG: hypothetical protein PHS04_05145 [Tissierellia bacterium]|nr:hypothetical protein [Tissierellia bacterium]